MKNIDDIISESIDGFLLQEEWYNPLSWFKKKVELTSVDYNDSGWYKGVSDGKELWIKLEPNEDWTKIERARDEDGREVEITNMPQGGENELMYYCSDDGNNCYWGVDGQWNLKRFYSYGNDYYCDNGGQTSWLTHLYFAPNEQQNQGEESQDQQETNGIDWFNPYDNEDDNANDNNIPQYVSPIDDNNGNGGNEQQTPQNSNNVNQTQTSNNNQGQQQQQSNILNLDEDNPLSNAITRLVQSGQLRDTMTANYLTRYLFELDL